jgi:hypothetical protein
MSNPMPNPPTKPNRRKPGANKLEPIDWHEYANDAVLNGNMSTLFHRPPTEDPSAYASPEALLEIEKRAVRVDPGKRVNAPVAPPSTGGVLQETVAVEPTVGTKIDASDPIAAIPAATNASFPVSLKSKKVKPLRNVQDALTLAGQILYQAMYGVADGTAARLCAKGYRQLAAETHLDKDTVRDLIVEFKSKGMVREVGSYNPDTRSSKTYEVLSGPAILQMWREAGILFVSSGRQRPEFCTAQGQPHLYAAPVRPTLIDS